MLAELARFYHLDPERILSLPEWLVHVLMRHLPALRAREMLDATLVESLPHMEAAERRRRLRELERMSRMDIGEDIEATIIEHDPKRAAEWFRKRGMKVQEGNG